MDIRRDADSDTGVITLTMDDGKRNALNPDVFAALDAELDGCADAPAVVLAGREGVFTAGLDVKFLASAGRDGVAELLVAFGRSLMRLWLEPRPMVCAATGHTLAAGTMYSMACDHTVAAEGEYAWGLTETQINFQMPLFGLALARGSMPGHRIDDLILPGRKIGPAEAVEAGYADELAPLDEVLTRAQAHAAELAKLPLPAYAGTKRRLRGAMADQVLAGLDDDIAVLLEGMDL